MQGYKNFQESFMVARVLCKVSTIVLMELQKWGPWHLKRWCTHHPLLIEILIVLSQSCAIPCDLVGEKVHYRHWPNLVVSRYGVG